MHRNSVEVSMKEPRCIPIRTGQKPPKVNRLPGSNEEKFVALEVAEIWLAMGSGRAKRGHEIVIQ